MAKRKRYTVQAKLDLFVSTEILADSLEAAVQQSKSLTEHDFVTISEGDYIDGNMEVTGVYN